MLIFINKQTFIIVLFVLILLKQRLTTNPTGGTHHLYLGARPPVPPRWLRPCIATVNCNTIIIKLIYS